MEELYKNLPRPYTSFLDPHKGSVQGNPKILTQQGGNSV